MCTQVAPSGECLLCYKPRVVDCNRLAPRVAASCLAKPSCYTWPVCRYSCCPTWQLVCLCMHCIDLFSCEAASVFTINLLYFTLLLHIEITVTVTRNTARCCTSTVTVMMADEAQGIDTTHTQLLCVSCIRQVVKLELIVLTCGCWASV